MMQLMVNFLFKHTKILEVLAVELEMLYFCQESRFVIYFCLLLAAHFGIFAIHKENLIIFSAHFWRVVDLSRCKLPFNLISVHDFNLFGILVDLLHQLVVDFQEVWALDTLGVNAVRDLNMISLSFVNSGVLERQLGLILLQSFSDTEHFKELAHFVISAVDFELKFILEFVIFFFIVWHSALNNFHQWIIIPKTERIWILA